ncbi:MAG: HD domain-containing phosphohydrolase, partial [Gaiellaceae bacterium]
DQEERRIVETHPEIGDKLLEPLDLLAPARPIVRHHHERWDGAGYPDRLAAEEIPLGARIVAVADSVEVMSSRQLYRKPLTAEGIVEELRRQRGGQWEPALVDIVLRLIDSGELVLSPDGRHLLELPAVTTTRSTHAILLVEDDDRQARLVSEALERALDGAVIARATSVAGAAELLNGAAWSLAVVDHNLPDGAGLEVLDVLRLTHPTVPVVMLTGQSSEEHAVEAFRRGASDFVVKSDSYLEALMTRVRGLVPA